VHLSAASHTPTEARHTVVVGEKTSAAQVAEVPLQSSAWSQTPAEPRHVVVLGANVQSMVQQGPPSHCSPASTTLSPQVTSCCGLVQSFWQLSSLFVFASSHCSPGSTTPLPQKGDSGGQLTDVPVQNSGWSSQFGIASRHTVVLGLRMSAGHVLVDPVQSSARSQTPAALRQTVLLVRNVQLRQQGPPSHCSPASTIPLPQSLVCSGTQIDGHPVHWNPGWTVQSL